HAAGHPRRALDLFAQSIAYAERQESPIMLADAHLELGRRLRALGGDAQAARRHLEVALSLYRQCDAAPYVSRARAALEQVGDPGAPASRP
ncbi:MAG TPA: hypothetical protein VLE53_13440, partial [Gemmatimonadaceae bacterium]|nr:hypothetical protein [Gemmatimonadaceae bacterium]